MARCLGTNKKGNQCGTDALPGLDYCKAHRNQGQGKNNGTQEVITHRHTDSVEPKQKKWFGVLSTFWAVLLGIAALVGGLSVFINLTFDFEPRLVVNISTERSNFFDDTLTFHNDGKVWLYDVEYKQQLIGLRFKEERTFIPVPNTTEEVFLNDLYFSLVGDIKPKDPKEGKLLLPFSVPVTVDYLSHVEAYATCTVTTYRYRPWFYLFLFKASKTQRDGFHIDKIHGLKNWMRTSCEKLFELRRQLFPVR